MALKHAILAALGNGESSGYDLAKNFDVGVANYWAATPQQIYRELDRMEDEGLVSARTVEQQRRPNKRLFSATPSGREALHGFVTRVPKPTALRDELLVKVEAVDDESAATVRAYIAQQLEHSLTKIDRYREMQQVILKGRSEESFFTDARRIGPYLTLMRGITYEQGTIEWCQQALAALDLRAS